VGKKVGKRVRGGVSSEEGRRRDDLQGDHLILGAWKIDYTRREGPGATIKKINHKERRSLGGTRDIISGAPSWNPRHRDRRVRDKTNEEPKAGNEHLSNPGKKH